MVLKSSLSCNSTNWERELNFTRLRLNGFKSFVDPSELQILPGLTGIVGPNGCGKSNLLDAIRWVMGDNRPSSMRGEGMDDVIFGGSDLRPARSFAEVVLELGKVDPTALPVNIDKDSVEIVRRINIESGSVYKIEGREVLAREIRMLFADSSTGSNSPSLVRQGQIASLINEHPKSRRKILEEAAGIAGIHQRRHESELKLNASESNLLRINDILAKLKEQQKILAKQAHQAGEYRSLGVSIRKEESLLLFTQWKVKKQEFGITEQKLGEILKARSIKQNESIKMTKNREEREKALPSLREKQAADQIGFRQLDTMRSSFDEKHRLAVSRIDELKKRTNDLEGEYLRETELVRDAEDVIQKLNSERGYIEEEKATLEFRLEKAKNESEMSEINFKKLDLEYEQVAANHAKLIVEKNSLAKNYSECERNINLVEEKISSLKADQIKVEERRLGIIEERERTTKSFIETDKLVNVEATYLKKLESDFQKVMVKEAAENEKLSEYKSKLATIVSEIQALEELNKDRSLPPDAVINKVSASLEYELALGAVLSDELNFPLNTEKNQSGWVKSQASADVKNLPEGINSLFNFVEHPKELERLLKNVGIVDSQDGLKLQEQLSDGQCLVSKEGDLWRWDGFIRRSSDLSSETALKLKNLNRLTKLHGLKKETADLVNALQESQLLIEEKLKGTISLRDITKNKYISSEKKLADLNLHLSKLDAEFEINQAQLKGFSDKYIQLQKDFEEFSYLLEANKIGEKLDQKIIISESSLKEKKAELESYRSKNLETRLNLEDILSKDEHGRARVAQISNDINDWESRKKRSLDQQYDILERKKQSQVLLKEASQKPDNIVREVEGLATKIKDAEKQCNESTNTLVEAERNLREAFLKERESQKIAEDFKEDYVRAEVNLGTLKQALVEIEVLLKENTGLSPNDYLAKYQKESESNTVIFAIQEKLEKLKRKRELIGPVNLRAEQDEKEITAEFEALNSQKEDLEAAISKLRKAILGLNKEGREKLLNAFDKVNKNFRDLFQTLFGGGSSNLMFLESEDPLEAGLEIMCQPPGKKLSSLSLLSGGEQTLAAISLIFAVFLARPSPICVLDEVDAPLDDSNIVRFCNLLDQMKSKTETRFLIITHNPITMAKMNRLFGVTMGEKGVSQLVSVDLDTAEELVEA